MYKRRKIGWLKHLDFLILDIIFIELSFILSHYLRNRSLDGLSDEQTNGILMFLVLIHICIAIVTNVYSGILRRGKLQELLHTVRHGTYIELALLVYLFVIHQTNEYSRILIASFWGISIILLYIVHIIYKKILKKFLRTERAMQPRMILMVDRARARESVRRVIDRNFGDYALPGVIVVDEDRKGDVIEGIPVVANFDDYRDYIRTNVVDEVFLQVGDSTGKLQSIADELLNMGIAVHINFSGLTGLPNKRVEKVTGFSVVTSSQKEVDRVGLLMKRLMDIVGSIVGLFITGIAFVIFAPIIYIQSPGPIFFKQERVGVNGRIFKIVKFRSMYPDAETRKQELMDKNKMKGLMFKMDDDPRIIPIGKFMRETSIDELPQFWNILKGDMSLVGTRPPTVDEYKLYANHHKRRLAVKPGLTGMWQVSGRSDITDFEEVVALDSDYIANWSFWLDVKLVWKTIWVVLKRKGSV